MIAIISHWLISQGTSIGGEEEEWYVRFTYQPRWIAYGVVTGKQTFSIVFKAIRAFGEVSLLESFYNVVFSFFFFLDMQVWWLPSCW